VRRPLRRLAAEWITVATLASAHRPLRARRSRDRGATPRLAATLNGGPRRRNQAGESAVAHPDTSIDQENRRQYLALLAAACARNAYDSSLLRWAVGLGLDLYAQRSTYFDGLVRAERVRRELDPPAENTSTRPPQRSANERAIDLLMENLTARQRDQYRTHQNFDVIGGQSGKRYRIWRRLHQNVEELDASGRRVCIWCVQPSGSLVLGDVLLAQKNALELFELAAMRVANPYSDFAANSWPDAATRAPPISYQFAARQQPGPSPRATGEVLAQQHATPGAA
jgi:hypothetical protein